MKKFFLVSFIGVLLLGHVNFLFATEATTGTTMEAPVEEDIDINFREKQKQLFPGWHDDNRMKQFDTNISTETETEVIRGVIGENIGSGEDRKLFQYLPRILDVVMKFVAALVVISVVYAGIRMVYAQGDEEEIKNAKQYFKYAAIGVVFILISYSLVKIVYSFISAG